MKALNDNEIKVFESMPDHRAVSDSLEKAFCSGGLSEFRKFIFAANNSLERKHEGLAVLLRGNDGKIIVYKDNHKIWELSVSEKSKKKTVCKVSFDFNHARYTKDWDAKYKKLHELGFSIGNRSKSEVLPSDIRIKIVRNDKKEVTGGEIGMISCTKEYFSKDFVEESYKIIHGLVKDFFRSQSEDYFRKAVATDPKYKSVENIKGAGANVFIEKRWQQRLLFQFQNMSNGCYAYDLEFSQKYPDKKYVDKFAKTNGEEFADVKAEEIKKKLGTNEPDMLAIRYEEGAPVALVLLEVKSTKSACEGSSGIREHMEGMKSYSEQAIFMRNRKRDAYVSLCQYHRMGIISENISIKEIPEDLPVEKVVLLTNANIPMEEGVRAPSSALDYYKDHKDDIFSWAKRYGCKVWITDSNYWDIDLKIEEVSI